MFGNHKIITNNEHLVCFNMEKIHDKNEAFRLQNQSKQSMHCNSNKWTIKLLHLSLHHPDLVLTK
jgi:hypothetical protein